jgi:3-hydroxyisobutyrate dehydrogenase-like beta-hydroxyacid dehydrogenase
VTAPVSATTTVGQKVKLLNNALFGAQVALASTVEQCAGEIGLDPALALRGIHEGSGDSYALRVALGAGSAARLVELAGRFIRKDVAVVRRSGASSVPTSGPCSASPRPCDVFRGQPGREPYSASVT